jgi:hypothetical protein
LLEIISSKFGNWFCSILNPEKCVGHTMVQTSFNRQKFGFSSRGGAYKLLGGENYTNMGTLQAGLLWYSAAGHHSTTALIYSTTTLPDNRISLLLHSHSQSPTDVCGRPHQPVPFYNRGPHYVFTFDSAFESLGQVFNIQQANNPLDRC